MNASDFLARPLLARIRLRKAEQWKAAMKSLTERVTVNFGLDAEPVSHSRNPSSMQDAIAGLMEAEAEVEERKKELAEVELEVGMVLARIPDQALHDFMVMKYLDLMTVRQIVNDMRYSYSWGRWMKERGTAEVQRILDEMEADGE